MAYRFVTPVTDVGSGIRPSSGAQLYFFDTGTSNEKTTYSDFSLSTPNDHPVQADANGRFPDIFLDVDAYVTLRDSSNNLIWGPKTVYPPSDSVTALAATGVSVTDAAGYYSAANVETVLAEVGLEGLRRDRAETVSNNVTYSSAEVITPILRQFSVKHNSIASSTGTLTVDLTTGNSFSTTLTENVTVAIVGATSNYEQFTLEITQDGGGGAYTVTQPASVKTQGGTAFVMSTGNDAIDELTYRTNDGGTVWKMDSGQAYA